MAISVEEFFKRLNETGLLSGLEVRKFREALLETGLPPDGERVSDELVERGLLTPYQAQAIVQDKTQRLVLGNYVILDLIGTGGMGMVFKAKHRRMGREVALKVLPPGVAEPGDALARFKREVTAAALLEHPHIVTAYDADESDGVHFLVMQYVEGRSLSAIVKAHGRMSVEEAVNVMLQVARGLAYAHQRGVIHRDIKPGNILIDRLGAAHLLDMGLARIINPIGGDDNDDLTKTGTVMGTASFMSPEQAFDIKSADHRSDVYSLGCTLFYALIGHAPYRGETVMAKLLAHRETPIPSLVGERADVPAPLDAIYQRMMAKKPEDRQQSMGQVIEDLEALYVDHDPASLGGKLPLTNERRPVWSEQSTAGTYVENVQPRRSPPPPDPDSGVSRSNETGATTPENGKTRPSLGNDPTVALDRRSILSGKPVVSVIEEQPPLRRFPRGMGYAIALSLLLGAILGGLYSMGLIGPDESSEITENEDDSKTKLLDKTEPPTKTTAPEPRPEKTPSVPEPGYLALELLGVDRQDVVVWRNDQVLALPAPEADGTFKIPLPAGLHQITIEKPDYQPATRKVHILAGRTEPWSVSLLPSKPPTPPKPIRKLPWQIAGPAESSLPGIVPRPAQLPGIEKWQLETTAPRGRVTAVAWHPNGKEFAAATATGLIRIYDGGTRKLQRLLIGHTADVAALSYRPDGGQLASASVDGSVRLWNPDGRAAVVFRQHKSPVYSVAWNSEGSRLVSGDVGGAVWLWNADGQPTKSLRDETQETMVLALAWQPSQTIAAGLIDGRIVFWNKEGQAGLEKEAHRDLVSSLAWNPTGDTLASTGRDGFVHLWNQQGREQSVIKDQMGEQLDCIAWSPDGEWLITSGLNAGAPRIFKRPGMPSRRLERSTSAVVSNVAWSSQGTIVSGGDTTLLFWDQRGEPLAAFAGETSENVLVSSSPKGGQLALGSRGQVRICDAEGHVLQTLKMPGVIPKAMAWNPAGDLLAVGGSDFNTRVWKPSGELAALLNEHAQEITALAWSLDGQRLVTASADKTLRIWSPAGQLLHTAGPFDEPIPALAWSSDGQQLAAALTKMVEDEPQYLIQFFTPEGKPASTLPAVAEPITTMAWQPGGVWLAVASRDGTVRLLTVAGKAGPVLQIPGQPMMSHLCWTMDGKFLVAGSSDDQLRVWNTAGELQTTMAAHRGILSLSCRPDSPLVAVGTSGGVVTVWNRDTSTPESTLLLLDELPPVKLSAGGQITSPGIDSLKSRLVYVVEESPGNRALLTPAEFAARFEGAIVED